MLYIHLEKDSTSNFIGQILFPEISVTIFADFDIKIVLLDENSFEWIAFFWVEYCVFLTYIESLKAFFIVTCYWLFQLYLLEFFVTSWVKGINFPT